MLNLTIYIHSSRSPPYWHNLLPPSCLRSERKSALLNIIHSPEMDIHGGAYRIAIWNKSWAIVTISMFIWVVNGAFMLQGNSTPLPSLVI